MKTLTDLLIIAGAYIAAGVIIIFLLYWLFKLLASSRQAKDEMDRNERYIYDKRREL